MTEWEVYLIDGTRIIIIADDFNFCNKRGTIWFTTRIFSGERDPHEVKAIFSPKNYTYCKRV